MPRGRRKRDFTHFSCVMFENDMQRLDGIVAITGSATRTDGIRFAIRLTHKLFECVQTDGTLLVHDKDGNSIRVLVSQRAMLTR